MKKAICILCAVCLLSGCGAGQAKDNTPETTTTTAAAESVAEPAYEDIAVGDLIFTAATKSTLTDRGKTSTSLDVDGKTSSYHIQAFIEDLGKDTIWSPDKMEERARVMHILENPPPDFDIEKAWDTPCDVSSESVSGFELYKLRFNDVDGLIACRQYGSNKYTFIARSKTDESVLDHYDDFKELLGNIKIT